MSTDHTPTLELRDDTRTEHEIPVFAANGEIVLRVGDGFPLTENAVSFAEFIVLACNSHAALVEALERLSKNGCDEFPPVGAIDHAREVLATAKEADNG